MAFCSKCGSVVPEGTAFCSVCGSPASAAGVPPTPPIPAGAASVGLSSNVAAALSYFFITGIIFLVVEKENKFVRFHAWQSIFAFGAWFQKRSWTTRMGISPYLSHAWPVEHSGNG